MTEQSRKLSRLGLPVFAALLLLLTSCGKEKPWRSLHLSTTSADKTHYSFLQRLSERENVLVVYSETERTIDVFKPAVGHAWPATLLGDGSFLVTVAPNINPPTTPTGLRSILYTCVTTDRRCKSLLSSDLGISSPIAIRDGNMLFAASPLALSPDHWSWTNAKYLKYRAYDLYSFRPGSDIRKLTDVHAIGMNWLSAGGKIVALQMARVKVPGSGIYCVPVGADLAPIDFKKDTSQTCIEYGANYDSAPNLSPSGNRVALLSSSTSAEGGWVYEIVVLERLSKKPIATISPAPGPMTLSNPVFVDEDTVRFIERREDRYLFKQFDIATKATTEVGAVEVKDILAARVTTIEDAK
jgi:hypothetical protein